MQCRSSIVPMHGNAMWPHASLSLSKELAARDPMASANKPVNAVTLRHELSHLLRITLSHFGRAWPCMHVVASGCQGGHCGNPGRGAHWEVGQVDLGPVTYGQVAHAAAGPQVVCHPGKKGGIVHPGHQSGAGHNELHPEAEQRDLRGKCIASLSAAPASPSRG